MAYEWVLEYLTPVVDFIPNAYQKLGIQWGLHPVIGAIIAFLVGALLLFGIFYLGMILAFGKVTSDERAHKAIILVSLAMGLLGAYYGAGVLVVILTNIIYVIGMFAGVIVAASVFRAMIAGWHGAGATLHEAIAAEEVAKAQALEHKKIKTSIAYEVLDEIIKMVYKSNPKAEKAEIVERVINTLKTDRTLAERFFGLKTMTLYDYYRKLFGDHIKLKEYIANKIEELRKSKNK